MEIFVDSEKKSGSRFNQGALCIDTELKRNESSSPQHQDP